MGVLYDAGSEYQRSISAATVTLTHTGTVANVAGVAVAFVKGGGTQPTITNVSYGGVTLLQIARATDTATEPGAAEIWYAGSGVPSGVRAVIYNTTTIASNVHVVITTWTSPHSTYAIGSGTKSANTASISVSLTTGYVSGYALGAFYGGGAEPATFTYATDRTLIHDWDMGAFYGEVFRHASPTAAGSGPTIQFGGDPKANDDVAFAAIFLTDGSIAPNVGAHTAQGLAPTILGEAVAAAPVGLVATGNLAPVATGYVFPGVGAVQAVPQAPIIQVPPNTHEPTLWTELKQNVGLGGISTVGQVPSETVELARTTGVGLITAQGLAPTLATERIIGVGLGGCAISGQLPGELRDGACGPGLGGLTAAGLIPGEFRELKQSVGVGLVQTTGQVPGEYRELKQTVGLGALVTSGQAPQSLKDGSIGPLQGLCLAGGLAPSLYLERIISPSVGGSVLEGRDPSASGDGSVEGSCAPDAGVVTIQGLVPTLVGTTAEEPRGHVIVKRRRRGNYGAVEIIRPQPKPEPPPVPAVALEPPEVVEPLPIAAIDTGPTEKRLKTLESRRARMRREEEELIAILMRAA